MFVTDYCLKQIAAKFGGKIYVSSTFSIMFVNLSVALYKKIVNNDSSP